MKTFSSQALILVITAFAAACTGNVNGKFFQDSNNNGKFDMGELPASEVIFTLSKDGKEIMRGKALPDGSFQYQGEKGVYCLTIENKPQEAPVNPFLANKQLGSPAVSDNSSSANNNEDSSSSGSSSQGNAADLAADAEARGEGDKCVEKKTFAGNITFEMPVEVNYVAQLARLREGRPCKIRPGESCVAEIRYPCACKLNDMFVPSDVVSVEQVPGRFGIAYDPRIGSVSFAEAIVPPQAAADSICSTQVKFNALPDIEAGEYNYKLKPEARCPDNTYTLLEIPLEVSAKVDLELEQKLFGNPQLGETVMVNMTLKNRGGAPVKNCKIICDYPLDVRASDRRNVQDHEFACGGRFNGHPAECPCDLEAGEEEKQFGVQYTLPDSIDHFTTFEFSCKVTADGLDENVRDILDFRLSPEDEE